MLSRVKFLRRAFLLLICLVSLVGQTQAQDDGDATKRTRPSRSEAPELAEGYDVENTIGENPTNIDADLNASFPQYNPIFKGRIPEGYFDWKRDLYQDYGLKLGFSYQSLYQTTSDDISGEDTAWGGWALVEAKWDAFDRGGDYQGSIVAALDWRHNIEGADPAFFQTDTGSGWPTDAVFLEWDVWFPALYWEQRLRKSSLTYRAGMQSAAQFIDFFRFKDGRTSFTGSPYTASLASMPAPGPGFGASFRWNPVENSEFYVVGSLNDVNFEVNEYELSNIWDESDFFYALEFGYNWRRGVNEFDHLHLLIFYADEVDDRLPVLANEAGGGFKLAGSKQWGRLVGFGSYTYNTAEGGPFLLTVMEDTITLGGAVLRPFSFGGEIGAGFTWANPIDDVPLVSFQQADPGENQYGLELYWKMLVTKDLYFTPSIQYIRNPTYNPDTNDLWVPGLKFRLFL